MMNYYLTKGTGTGVDLDPYRPDIPAGTDYVGMHDVDYSKWVISTPAILTTNKDVVYLDMVLLEQRCAERGLVFNDVVNKWYINRS